MNVVEANGAKIPAIGLGTMTLMDAVCVEAVQTAIRLGYRHIDTAERYRNETKVGEGLRRGLRAAGLAREEVFVTTKVFHDRLAAADFERSLEQSLRDLELSWVDLLLIHWPNPKCRSRRRSTFCAKPSAMAERSMSESRTSPRHCCKMR